MLKRLISVLASGITAGIAIGIVRGIIHVLSNHYIEQRLFYIALDSVQGILLNSVLILVLLFLLTYIVYSAVVRLAHRNERWRTWTSGTVIPLIFLSIWLYSGYHLNKLADFPAFWSTEAFFLNGCLTLALAGAAFLAYRYRARIPLPRIWSINRREVLISVGLVVAIMIGRLVAYRPADGEDMNIILITIDTLRSDHLGCYGYERDTSPAIDRLAEDGVLFKQAVVQWPKTSPSFASMMTSTYGHQNGVTAVRQRLGDFNTTIAEVLRNSGYLTAGIISNGNLAVEFNFNQGFETYEEPWTEPGVGNGDKDGCDAREITNHAVEWLDKNGGKEKFFLWVHYIDPHARYTPPPPYDTLFVNESYVDDKDDRLPLNEGLNEDMGGIPGRSRLGDHDRLGYYISQYDGEIRYMDDQVGRLIRHIRDLDMWDNLLIILTADHGESLGEHNYYFEHGRFPYDPCARVPLIVSGGIVTRHGVQVGDPVAIMDIYPTILDYTGIHGTGSEMGRSLRGSIEGNASPGHRYIFMESGYERDYQKTIRNGRWKLIYIPDTKTQRIMNSTEFALYDLSKDPGETKNLIEDRMDVAEEMKSDLFRWMSDTGSLNGVNNADHHGRVAVDKETEAHLRALGYVQ